MLRLLRGMLPLVLAVVVVALSSTADAAWPHRSVRPARAVHQTPSYYWHSVHSRPATRPTPGYEYRFNRYEARTAGGYNRLFSF